jgi:hypothetical protein
MSNKNKNKNNNKSVSLPFVTLCTPTFNRRPFIPIMLRCFHHQTYPKDRIEWLIIDDGTDKIEDLIKDVPQIKYFKFDEKMTLGKKRNFLNDKAVGDIIIFIDDDDYYPPERISHAVEMLQKTPKALCAGSSEMLIYFKHINKMYQFGPYGPNHATAATFAFKKELLKITRFSETASLAEEKHFLKDYTIPFVQLDSKKCILVFSHVHNSFDKKELLKTLPNPTIKESSVLPSEMIQEENILNFFLNDIDDLLDIYKPGHPENKPDVLKQIQEMTKMREEMMKQQNQQNVQNIINQQQFTIQQLTNENNYLKEKMKYIEDKMTQLINEKIKEKKRIKEEELLKEKEEELLKEKEEELLKKKEEELLKEKEEELLKEKEEELLKEEIV